MKKIIFICVCLLINCSNVVAQEYELLNDIFKKINDTILIKSNFEPWSSQLLEQIKNEDFFKNNWEPLKSNKTPNIKLFLDSFDLKTAVNKLENQNDTNQTIEFHKFSNNIFGVEKVGNNLSSIKSYLVLAKPIFNQDSTWALSYSYGVYNSDVSSSGYLKIYRKLRDKWIYYHKITLWIS